MKSITLIIILFFTGVSIAGAQSQSFQTLHNKFSNNDVVHSFSTSGLIARTVLWLTGEHEFTAAIKEIKNIRVIFIPQSAFRSQALSVQGFKKVVKEDAYEELAQIHEEGNEVSVYLQNIKKSSMNRYLILIYNPDEVVAIEIMEYIDLNKLSRKDSKLSSIH